MSERAAPSLDDLRVTAELCTACPLYRRATQTVFGVGSVDSKMVLVGEQPGDQEDRAGLPFVGPAGRVLDEALEDAGIDREAVYVTNAVKHFKWEPRGKRRIHKRPSAGEVAACRPWLSWEIALVHPELVVAMGSTAAQSLLGPATRVTRDRGRPSRWDGPGLVLVTVHPSAVLRGRDGDSRRQMMDGLVADLRAASRVLSGDRSRDDGHRGERSLPAELPPGF